MEVALFNPETQIQSEWMYTYETSFLCGGILSIRNSGLRIRGLFWHPGRHTGLGLRIVWHP